MSVKMYIENKGDEELELFRIQMAAPLHIKLIIRSNNLILTFFLVLDISLLQSLFKLVEDISKQQV